MDDLRTKVGWRCPRCGEENPEWFGSCWSCAEDRAAVAPATSPSAALPVFEIDGLLFDTLDDFFTHFAERSGLAHCCGNLDAFNDILRPESGFGAPPGGFIIRWRNHKVSMERLNGRYPHAPKRSRGPTMFDAIIEIIREHGPRGAEASDNVQLELL